MSRSVIASESLQNYLARCAESGKFSHGLIIGQPSYEKKDYVTHFAQTRDDSILIKEPEEDVPLSEDAIQKIGEEALLHHLISATRMIPGSFFVLGLFAVSEEDIFAKKQCLDSLKSVIRTANGSLKRMRYNAAEGLPQHMQDQLILFYSSVTKTPVCKSYNLKTNTLSPVEWKFVKNPGDFHLFETSYEFDDVFPLIETAEGINLEHNFFFESLYSRVACFIGIFYESIHQPKTWRTVHLSSLKEFCERLTMKELCIKENVRRTNFVAKKEQEIRVKTKESIAPTCHLVKQSASDATRLNFIQKDPLLRANQLFDSLDNIALCIQSSEIFIQNEKVDEQLHLEAYLKSKKSKSEETEYLKASIFLRELISHSEPPILQTFQGTIKFQGTVLSRVWSHSKSSFKEIEAFIRNDIIRSVAARTQIFCDSLSNSIASREIFISEPPRRVFFPAPECAGIQCCEYLFRNETPEVACDQAKEILDLDIDPADVLMNSEGLPDLEDSSSSMDIVPIIKDKKTANEITKNMYILGIVTALVVLVISISLHFILR